MEKDDAIKKAKSVSELCCVVSTKRYLNWQKYDLLEEIITEYGDSKLKGGLSDYCKEVEAFESKTLLSDVKNIIFTPSGSNDYFMKVPVPKEMDQSLALVRHVKNGCKKNGHPIDFHHSGQNSPLAIYFIVPRLLVPPTEILKLKAKK